MRTFILFLLTFGMLNVATAQEYLLKGKVTDSQNNPLSGVSVLVKSTQKGVSTDFDGKFEIMVKSKDILVFSYIGFLTQEIPVKGKKNITVILKEDNQALEEVVVLAYETQKEAAVVGNVLTDRSSGIRIKDEHETYKAIDENNFKQVSKDPISTFSADVDRASYSNVRRMINNGYLPNKDAVRVEEMINYFDYDYPEPTANSDVPFQVSTQLSNTPWNEKNYLLQIGLQAKKIKMEDTPPSNIVFLIDV